MKKESKLAIGIALGISIGTVIGILTDNIGLWLSVGIAIGAGLGTILSQSNTNGDKGKSASHKSKTNNPE